MILVALWLLTSAYAVQLGMFPNPETCAMVALQMDGMWKASKPRPFLYRMACVPTFVPVQRPAQPPKTRDEMS